MKKPNPLAEIVSTGRYVPDRVLTNADLERMVDTSDAWITERTGIKQRRIAEDCLGAAEMGARAARVAMARAGVEPGEVDLIVVSTATPDRLLPSTACDMQALLGADNAVAFDLGAACSGWLYGLSTAEGFIASGTRGDCAGRGNGEDELHRRLERPRDLRAVRRRRGSGSGAPRQRPTWYPVELPPVRRQTGQSAIPPGGRSGHPDER